MLSVGTTISNLSAPNSFEHQEGLVLPGQQHVAEAALGEGRGRAAGTGVEHRHVAEQVAEIGLGLGLVAAELVQRPAIGREVVPARAARGLGVRRDHRDARLGEVAPVLDALRIALADQEHDGRGVGRAVVAAGGSASPSAACRSCSAIASMSAASASVTTSASSPSITARACLPEPPCDMLDGDRLAGLLPSSASANALLKSW